MQSLNDGTPEVRDAAFAALAAIAKVLIFERCISMFLLVVSLGRSYCFVVLDGRHETFRKVIRET